MHEQLHDEFERQEKRLDNRIFVPPKVSNLNDLKATLRELDPTISFSQSIPISTEVVGTDEHNAQARYHVSAATESQSKREMLLNGFNTIKARVELAAIAQEKVDPVIVNGREMRAPVVDTVGARMWVDPLIERWLNARREGMLIVWDLPEGTYKYDIFQHRLFKAKVTDG